MGSMGSERERSNHHHQLACMLGSKSCRARAVQRQWDHTCVNSIDKFSLKWCMYLFMLSIYSLYDIYVNIHTQEWVNFDIHTPHGVQRMHLQCIQHCIWKFSWRFWGLKHMHTAIHTHIVAHRTLSDSKNGWRVYLCALFFFLSFDSVELLRQYLVWW